MKQDVIFKEAIGSENQGDGVWFHASCSQAVIFDSVETHGDNSASILCLQYLRSLSDSEQPAPEQLLLELHNKLKSKGKQAVAAVVTQVEDGFTYHWVGNLNLYSVAQKITPLQEHYFKHPFEVLGQEQLPLIEVVKLPVSDGATYLLSTDGLDHIKLLESGISQQMLERSMTGTLSRCKQTDDWAAIIFPITQSQTFARKDWPYNPFIGQQEEREHEKRGLSEIANNLFQDTLFDGFKITACPPLVGANSSKLLDGVLLCSAAIIPLELKDYHGQVTLDLDKTMGVSVINELGHKAPERRPDIKVREALRAFENLGTLKSLIPERKRTGLLVFTHPHISLKIFKGGEEQEIPYVAGDVLIATTKTLPLALRKKFKSALKKKPIGNDLLGEIASELNSTPISDHSSTFQVGDYTIELSPIEIESNDFFSVYPAWCDGDSCWAKLYKFDHLGRGDIDRQKQILQIEKKRLRQLANRSSYNFQRVLDMEETQDGIYLFVNEAPSLTLRMWLDTSPSRQQVLLVLRQVAEVLRELSGLQIVHRAINLDNIRLDKTLRPIVVNFGYSQTDSLATLPMTARRTWDLKFVAPEVLDIGKQLTPSADIYSFGLIVIYALAGRLPFKNQQAELKVKLKNKAFWKGLSDEMGIGTNLENIECLQRITHSTAQHRPMLDDVMKLMESWT